MEKIYIVCVGIRAAIVYEDKSPYTRLNNIELNMEYPWDIAACKSHNRLYISDKTGHCLWMCAVKKTGDYEVRKWIQTETGQDNTISVTNEGNVLMLNPTWLNVYNPKGSQINSIRLPREIQQPQHAVATLRGTYFVSHGIFPESQHRISEISPEGYVLRSFGDRNGNGKGQLDWPLYTVIDSEDRLFVSDFYNQRIILLDSQLRLRRVILTREENKIASVLRISYDNQSGNLLLGTILSQDGGCHIFRIRNPG